MKRSVQKTASLHEKAVQAIATGEVSPQPTGRRRGPERPPAAITTKDIKLHDMALAAVQEIIGGSHGFTRYEILDETTAVVR